MLKPKVLTEVLSQANGGGIECTLLLNHEGSVLGSAGDNDKMSRVTAAIAANIWQAYSKAGQASLDDTETDFILLNCENGRVAIHRVSKLLLCVYAKSSVEPGLLRAKVDAMVKHLQDPLEQIVL
eukprot:Colp12_sorted_trinity150504_noHs@23896